MKSSLDSFHSTGSFRAPALRPLAMTALLYGVALAAACGDDDDTTLSGGGAGGSGGANAARPTGSAGAAGLAGSAGSAGSAGAAGTGGAATASTHTEAAGLSDAGIDDKASSGTVTVLNADAATLHYPTKAAVRGTDIWVVNSQLDELEGTPSLPFNVVSVPLAGGPASATAIELSDDDFFPEGIAASADGTLYIGSTSLGTIVRVPPGATAPEEDDFVAAGVAQRGVVGLTIDEARTRLWFCDSSRDATSPGADLVGVNLDTGVEEVRHNLPDRASPATDADAGANGSEEPEDGPTAPPATFCNDVVVAPNGDIFATDSTGRVFRVAAADADTEGDALVWLDDPAITVPGGDGPTGIDLVGNELIISSQDLVVVDATSDSPASTLRVLTLTENGTAVELCGPDGLQTVPDSNNEVVLIENGSCPAAQARVVRITLDID
jgi:sugar lactone lactonase YvrE